MSQGYGYSDYFSRHLSDLGAEAWEIVHNAEPLQKAWAKENNTSKSGYSLIMEQIARYRPDVVFIQDSVNFPGYFVKGLREYVSSVKLQFGHCCAPFTEDNLMSFGEYDFVLTCSQHFQNLFQKHNLKTYLFRHAVEDSIIERIKQPSEKFNEIIFTGSLLLRDEFHRDRTRYIEQMIKEDLPLKLFGFIEEESLSMLVSKQMAYLLVRLMDRLGIKKPVEKSQKLHKVALLKEFPKRPGYSRELLKNLRKSEFYGLEMLQKLSEYSVGFNMHGQVAGDYAANVRMFEVTGVRSVLLTDNKKNIKELFEPDSEIVTYNNPEECIEKAKWLINNPLAAGEIALAGQRRTLKDHTVKKRAEQLHNLILDNLKQ
jgi:spore maturation protein CgeB